MGYLNFNSLTNKNVDLREIIQNYDICKNQDKSHEIISSQQFVIDNFEIGDKKGQGLS